MISVLELDVGEALAELEQLGSSEDPIVYQGQEMTPSELVYRAKPNLAKHVRVSFWGEVDGRCRLIRGSNLARMVADRRKLQAETICQECGREIR